MMATRGASVLCRMRDAKSNPFIPGISTSVSTKFGRASSNMPSASSPDAACAITVTPGRLESHSASVILSVWLSSTSSTRSGVIAIDPPGLRSLSSFVYSRRVDRSVRYHT